MSEQTENHHDSCIYCGTPVRVRISARLDEAARPLYCCSGCLFADSLTQSLKQDRLSLWMVGAAATLFLVFNQILFLLLGLKYGGQGYQSGAVLCGLSLLIGGIAWGVVAGVVCKLHKNNQAPRPIAFVGVVVLFAAGLIGGMIETSWLGSLGKAGLGLSFLTIFFCFAQGWFRSRKS